MKKLIKYRRLCAILLLIVLISSNAHVCAETTDKQSGNVLGSGTLEDPYIINVTGGGYKVVLEPNEVPFYFKVTGTGGVGGVFAIDYDTSKGSVTFTLTNTVNFKKKADYVYSDEYNFESEDIGVNLVGETDFSISVENTNFLNNSYQLGITAYGVEKIELSKYKITEEYTQIFYSEQSNSDPYPNGCVSNYSDPYSTATRSMELTNVNSDITTGASSSKSDLYFFAKNIETEDDLKSFYAASGYQYTENEGSAYEYWKFVDVILDSRGYTSDISIPKEGEITDNVTLVYKFEGLNNTAFDDQQGASTVEEILSRVFMAFGDILLDMIQLLFGKDLTIDALIFNKYDDTKLSFYSKSSNNISSKVASVVNIWYGIFSKLAYVLYVVVLVYIGVMIIVTAGTGDQDKKKKSLGDWLAGLAIMFAVPTFVLPSLIKINDAFVEFMYSKNTDKITTYYNYYDAEGDILGGDSATLSIDELITKKEDTEEKLDTSEGTKEEKLKEINKRIDDLNIDNELAKKYFGKDFYERYKSMRASEISAEYSMTYCLQESNSEILDDVRKQRMTIDDYTTIGNFVWERESDSYYDNMAKFGMTDKIQKRKDGVYVLLDSRSQSWVIVYDADNPTEDMREIFAIYEEIYKLETTIDTIDSLIEVKQTDLMSIMRDYAGKYKRMVFVMVWLLLIFQMVAMLFMYYKRIFVIAVLIAIFPLIMIFYCIDKMADGSAQTLSMWFKELISDIFIQSIHCIMYVVLVHMGLDIYKGNSSNWFLFLAAMLMLVPAERMMKEIFGLNSGSLGQLGGMGMNIAMGIGAAVKLGKMGIKGAGNFLMR